jgi:dienelactone hydrolase
MNISSNPLTYRHGETVMKGEFVFDSARSGPRPGVLVVHEAFGLGDHAIASARRLAERAMPLWRSIYGATGPS